MTDTLKSRIEPVMPQQAAELSALCHQIYPQYFTYLWYDEGDWYVEYSYNETKLSAELRDPNVRYFFAVVNGKRVGYLKLKLNSNLDESAPDGFEVERIYFLKEAAGQGLGKQFMEFAFAMARRLNKRYVWLHVMDSSLDSMAFYKKLGFEPVGETRLPFEPMKPEFRRMWRMKKML